MTTEERITARIQALETEMQKYIIAAEQQVVAYQAAIGELKKLLEPEMAPEVTPEAEPRKEPENEPKKK